MRFTRDVKTSTRISPSIRKGHVPGNPEIRPGKYFQRGGMVVSPFTLVNKTRCGPKEKKRTDHAGDQLSALPGNFAGGRES